MSVQISVQFDPSTDDISDVMGQVRAAYEAYGSAHVSGDLARRQEAIYARRDQDNTKEDIEDRIRTWTASLIHETSLAAVAQQAGLTRLTVEKFINRETVPHINTLGKLDNLIYAWENGALTLKGKDIFRKGSVRP